MNVLIAVLGILCCIVGTTLINFYQDLAKKKKQAGLSFELRNAGIGLIIIGIGLLIKSCN